MIKQLQERVERLKYIEGNVNAGVVTAASKSRHVNAVALYDDILDHEYGDHEDDYRVMPSTLDGPYVVKYVRSQARQSARDKQQTERSLLEQIAGHDDLRAVCQSLAPGDVVSDIVTRVRRARANARANATKWTVDSEHDIFDASQLSMRLTVSANFKLDGFVEVRKLLSRSSATRASPWSMIAMHCLISKTLDMLHAHGIYHGDMHMRNVLYKLEENGVAHIRVIDFDLGYAIPEANRDALLGGSTVQRQRDMYDIRYSYPNYLFTDGTRLLANNASRVRREDRDAYDTTVYHVARLRGLISYDALSGPSIASMIGAQYPWRPCEGWPSSIRGVATFARYDALAGVTWVLRVVQTSTDHDDRLFAHEICMALQQPADKLIRGIACELTPNADLSRFGLVVGVPPELALACLLVLRVSGVVSFQSDSANSTVLVDEVPVMADLARVFPQKDAFASDAAYEQFDALYAQPMRARLQQVDDARRREEGASVHRVRRSRKRPRTN